MITSHTSLTPHQRKNVKHRNVAVLWVLLGLVVFMFGLSIVRMKGLQKLSVHQKNKNTGIILGAVALVMVCLAFASVPLYRLFCQKTGYGGTPQIAGTSDGIRKDRVITVRFAANTARGFPWMFEPAQTEVKVYAGEVGLAFYKARNHSDKPLVGMSTYNVTPLKAGIYFNKIECFCFIEQLLQPGQYVDMPLQFFIDPAIADDPYMDDVKTITLSYTFFPFEKGRENPHTWPMQIPNESD